MTAHESFFVYRDFRYLKWAALLALVCVIAYAVYNPLGGHNGGTWLGYPLGTVGVVLILWLMWFGMKKRAYNPGGWRLEAWLSAHIYLGLSLIVVATLHTGFQFGWNVHTLAYALMMLVIASGAFGIYAYARFPRLMTENRRGASLDGLFQEMAELDRQCREIALGLPDEFVRAVQMSQNETRIGGSFWRQVTARDPSCGTHRALARVRDMARRAPADRVDVATRLLVALGKKVELVDRARADVRYKALLDVWLYIHVPISFALLAALIVHVISVFFYW